MQGERWMDAEQSREEEQEARSSAGSTSLGWIKPLELRGAPGSRLQDIQWLQEAIEGDLFLIWVSPGAFFGNTETIHAPKLSPLPFYVLGWRLQPCSCSLFPSPLCSNRSALRYKHKHQNLSFGWRFNSPEIVSLYKAGG